MKPQIERYLAEGYTAWAATLTLRHTRGDSLNSLFDGLSRAWSLLMSGREMNTVRGLGDLQFTRGYDLTYGQHGWHPHIHVMFILGPEHEHGDVPDYLLTRWQECLTAAGFEAKAEALHIQRVDDPEAAARYAVSPAAVYESMALSMKRARKSVWDRTPFEILAEAMDGDAQSMALWREYVTATKGRRQVTTSRGLTLKDEPEEGEESDALAEWGKEAHSELNRRGMLADLHDAAEDGTGDPDTARANVEAILSGLESRSWKILLWNPDPEMRAEKSAGFRTTMDELDLRALTIPESPEQRLLAEIRNRQQLRAERMFPYF